VGSPAIDDPALVIVHDRYHNHDKIPGVIHQLRCRHLLRDLEDAASYAAEAVGMHAVPARTAVQSVGWRA